MRAAIVGGAAACVCGANQGAVSRSGSSWSTYHPSCTARAGCMPRDAVDQRYVDVQDGWYVDAELPLRLTAP
jgi:hypothetical protein